MKLKRVIIFVLCSILAFSLVACSKPGDVNNGGNGDGTCTITYDVDCTEISSPKPTIVNMGETCTFAVPDDRADYKFDGWYTQKNGGGIHYIDGSTAINGNVTLYAKWKSKAEADAEANEYEANLKNWAQPGHLYIHYKRYSHDSGEEGTENKTAPDYSTAIKSKVYSDFGLWIWAKNDEGRLFNAMKIDVSGAVYDVLLDHDYNDGAWDANAKTDKGMKINYTVSGGAPVVEVGMLLFSISSRKGEGHWKSDGGNNYHTYEEMKHPDGSYHWFVTQGSVTLGSTHFNTETVVDPYADDTNHDKHASKHDIDSTKDNSSKYPLAAKAQGYDEAGVGYQIFVASFADGKPDGTYGKGMGNLRGIINKLNDGYFTDLNVDVLWLTPFQTSTNYHGYDIKDWYSVDSRFGTLDDYRELVYTAHKKGIKVVMDYVLNHTATSNIWYVKSQNLVKEKDANGNEIDYRNFYNWITEAQYNKLTAIEKEQWFADNYGYYYYSSFSSDQPELNYDYQPVRDAIIDVAKYWMAFGLDGFRLDAVKHIYMRNEVVGDNGVVDKSSNSIVFEKDMKSADKDPYSYNLARNLNFYREFNSRLKAEYPNAYLVGENLDGNPTNVAPFYCGIDSQFNFNLYYDAGRSIAATSDSGKGDWIGAAITQYVSDYQKFSSVNSHYIDGLFTSNHDLPRARDRMNIETDGAKDDFRSFFSAAGTTVKVKDKDGNLVDDKYGDKSSGNKKTITRKTYMDASNTPDEKKVQSSMVTMTDKLLRMYYAYNMTLPGVSWIYYGDEIGMTGNMDVMINSGYASGASAHEDRIYRQPMKWYDKVADNASYLIGFETFKCELVGLNATSYVKGVDAQKKDKNSLLNWMCTLTKVRNDHPELINGTVTVESSSNGLLKYVVTGKNGKKVRVYINAGGNTNISGTVYASYNLSGTSLGKYGVAICAA